MSWPKTMSCVPFLSPLSFPHDLDLATTAELKSACRTVHFAEQFTEVDGKKIMSFDYRMQPGIAETTNALKLLEMVGLGE